MKSKLITLSVLPVFFFGCGRQTSEHSKSDVSSDLYIEEYGNSNDPTIVFIHGGPGFNSFNFEVTTAQSLAERGYRVIVYDQLGSGRSPAGVTADYTFDRAARDLDFLLKELGVREPTLLGHSFGGTIALKYAERFPHSFSHLILAASPIDYPAALANVLEHCQVNYEKWLAIAPDSCEGASCVTKKHFADRLYEIGALKSQMFLEGEVQVNGFSEDNVAAAFEHGLNCGLYLPKQLSDVASGRYRAMAEKDSNSLLGKNASDQTDRGSPFLGFMRSEKYAIQSSWDALQHQSAHVSFIHGIEDGLFDDEQCGKIRNIVMDESFYEIENASHNMFMDQQEIFLDTIDLIMKKANM